MNKVEIGDLIYTVAKSGILPLFTSPLGNASVIAGSSQIVGGVTVLDDETELPSGFYDKEDPDWLPDHMEKFCDSNPTHKWCDIYCTSLEPPPDPTHWCAPWIYE